MFWYGLLTNYVKENGNCLVPGEHKTKDDYKLGIWVKHQRKTKDTMSQERRDRLEKLGFVWGPHDEKWEQGYSCLEDYIKENGNSIVPFEYKTKDNVALGTWVSKQRQAKDTMSQERRDRLEKLGFVWGPHDEKWEQGYSCLEDYIKENGNCIVPNEYETEDGYPLYSWVGHQRETKRLYVPRKT